MNALSGLLFLLIAIPAVAIATWTTISCCVAHGRKLQTQDLGILWDENPQAAEAILAKSAAATARKIVADKENQLAMIQNSLPKACRLTYPQSKPQGYLGNPNSQQA